MGQHAGLRVLSQGPVIVMVLVVIAGSCGCVSLPGSTVPATATPVTLSDSYGGSYVQPANPVLEGTPREVRDLSGRSGESSSPVLRKSLDDCYPVYTGSYSPKYSYSAFEVHVGKGPLIIRYTTVPLQYDPRISFLKITVRNAKTTDIVAESGYGEPYPSDRVNTITVNGDGDYHVTIYGNQVNVRVSVYTGDSMERP